MPQRASTQSTLSIIDIKEDIAILTNKRYRAVIQVKAINFDLLSEDEQDAIIYAYASLINSLNFPIQILLGLIAYTLHGEHKIFLLPGSFVCPPAACLYCKVFVHGAAEKVHTSVMNAKALNNL